MVNETFKANPLCLGAGCGTPGGGEPTGVRRARHPVLLCHTALTGPRVSALLSLDVRLFPHLQDEVSNNSLGYSYFSGLSRGSDEVKVNLLGNGERQCIPESLTYYY